jgi:hypothetical protein
VLEEQKKKWEEEDVKKGKGVALRLYGPIGTHNAHLRHWTLIKRQKQFGVSQQLVDEQLDPRDS